jgi:hypothetical protein
MSTIRTKALKFMWKTEETAIIAEIYPQLMAGVP